MTLPQPHQQRARHHHPLKTRSKLLKHARFTVRYTDIRGSSRRAKRVYFHVVNDHQTQAQLIVLEGDDTESK
jgi:hypothetical protein